MINQMIIDKFGGSTIDYSINLVTKKVRNSVYFLEGNFVALARSIAVEALDNKMIENSFLVAYSSLIQTKIMLDTGSRCISQRYSGHSGEEKDNGFFLLHLDRAVLHGGASS